MGGWIGWVMGVEGRGGKGEVSSSSLPDDDAALRPESSSPPDWRHPRSYRGSGRVVEAEHPTGGLGQTGPSRMSPPELEKRRRSRERADRTFFPLPAHATDQTMQRSIGGLA